MLYLVCIIGTLLLSYGAVVAFMFIFQRHLQYHPLREKMQDPEAYGLTVMKTIDVTTEDSLKIIAWYAASDRPDGRVVVMFHGNAGNISNRSQKVRYFLSKGYGVYQCEYRGFGGNPGHPTEQGFYLDAKAGIDWLSSQGIGADKMIIYGESIGTGVAVEIARRIQPGLVVLEAPFSSATDVAMQAYPWLPVRYLIRDRFDSLSKIKEIKAPLLILHGDEDTTISITLAQKLFEAANHPKEFITINGGGHSDLYEHHAGHIILEWLEKQA